MYYNLTQKQYRDLSKEFKKTFIGKSRYRDYLGCSILNIYFMILLTIEFIYSNIKEIQIALDFNNIILILLCLIFTSLNIITRIIYDKALKEYIFGREF